MTNVSAKKCQKLEKPYSSWFLACCQFSDSVEWTVDSYTACGAVRPGRALTDRGAELQLLGCSHSILSKKQADIIDVPHESKKSYRLIWIKID